MCIGEMLTIVQPLASASGDASGFPHRPNEGRRVLDTKYYLIEVKETNLEGREAGLIAVKVSKPADTPAEALQKPWASTDRVHRTEPIKPVNEVPQAETFQALKQGSVVICVVKSSRANRHGTLARQVSRYYEHVKLLK